MAPLNAQTLMTAGQPGQVSQVYVVPPGLATMLLVGGETFTAEVLVTMDDPARPPAGDTYVALSGTLTSSDWYALPPGLRGVAVRVLTGAVDSVQASSFDASVVNVTRDVSAQYLEDLENARLAAVAAGNSQLAPTIIRVSALEVDVTDLRVRTATVESTVTAASQTVNALTPRVTDVEDSVTALTIDMTATEGDLAALSLLVTTARGNIAGLDGRLSTAEGTLVSLDARLDAAEPRLTAAEGQVSAVSGAVTSLTTRVGNAEGNVTGLTTRMSAAENAAAALATRVTTVEGGVTTLTTRTAAAETAATALTTRVGTAEGNITGLSGRVTTLEGASGVTVSPYLSPPANPTAGRQWFESTLGRLLTYDGAAWRGAQGRQAITAAVGFRTVFNTYAAGVGVPAGWVRYWDSGAVAQWSVVARADAPGGKALQGRPATTSGSNSVSLLGPAGLSALDMDIVTRVRLPTAADLSSLSGTTFGFVGVGVRLSGDVASAATAGANGYTLRLNVSTFATAQGSAVLTRVLNGASTAPSIGGTTGERTAMRPGETWYVRLRAVGDLVQGKWWAAGEIEPGWMFTYRDSTPVTTPGGAGVYISYSSSSTTGSQIAADYELVAVGLDGAPPVY